MAGWRQSIGRLVAVGAGVLVAVGLFGGVAAASPTVNGAGSPEAAPILEQWAADVSKSPYDLSINYTVTSSASAEAEYFQNLIDFAETDAPTSSIAYPPVPAATTSQHPSVFVPVEASGLSFGYNLGSVALDLTPEDVCGIFTGVVTEWSQLTGTTGDAGLSGAITPVLPGSVGEDWSLSQYCERVDPTEWEAFTGDTAPLTPTPYWPYELSVRNPRTLDAGGEPDATIVTDQTAGAVTFVADPYAANLSLPTASVQNPAGSFTQPTAQAVQAGMAGARLDRTDGVVEDPGLSDPSAYQPATVGYVLAPTTTDTPDANVTGPLAQYLCYGVGPGQQVAGTLRHAPLSASVAAAAVDQIEQIPDAPPAAACGTTESQPPSALPEFPVPAIALGAAALVLVGVPSLRRRRRSRA